MDLIPDAMPLLVLQNLSITFVETGTGDLKPMVFDVSLEIDPGEVLALVGESGSGKSLTTLAIGGLLPRNARVDGKIAFARMPLLALDEKKMQKVRGKHIAYIFQEPMACLNPLRTIGFQICESIRIHNPSLTRKEIRETAINILGRLYFQDPEEILRSRPHQLSGGMQQRAGIAMAICNHPQLLIADEPTTALDMASERIVLDLLRELQRTEGFAFLLVTHNLNIVREMAQRVAIMHEGRVVEFGKTFDIFSNPKHEYTRELLGTFSF
ncbi:MAG: ABC transporter ATP-binding protein [Puniceicoccales bacterium]|jgi:ABC-type glutathione transport system ATPase component|nr:ABC transporter ATP-binding protein [Puniceicoccales bacterium]